MFKVKWLIAASFTLLILLSGTGRADLITFVSPAVSQPPGTQATNGNWFNAYPLTTAIYAGWDDVLTVTMNRQGFNTANGWTRGGYVSLADDTTFTINSYSTHAGSTNGGVEIDLVLAAGNLTIPAASTFHWLQLIQSDKQRNFGPGGTHFRYSIGIAPGFWSIDNGGYASGIGFGPYYDSNGFPPATYSFYDRLLIN